MKKRGIQVFIAIIMVLCLLIPLFTASLSPVSADIKVIPRELMRLKASASNSASECRAEAEICRDWATVARGTSYIAGALAILWVPIALLVIPPAELAVEFSDLADEFEKLASKWDKIAEDPPSDIEYTEVFQIRPRAFDPWLPEPTTSLDLAAITWTNSELRVIEETEALAVSLERAGAALSEWSVPYFSLQMQAVLDYTNMLITDLTALASSSVEFNEEWVSSGITPTPNDYASYQERIETEGFSADELQALKQGLLATDEEIQQIKNDILSVNPVAQWEEIQSALPGLHDVILSTLSALNDFANEAQRILSQISVATVTVFPNIYIGIGAAFGAGLLAYVLRRRFVRQG